MQGYNLIAVFDPPGERILMCKRSKEPYLGLYNLVGGKIEPGEDSLDAAYRELYEETSIGREDITLIRLMDFRYYNQNCYVEVYYGTLKRQMQVSGDENELVWLTLDHNFFDLKLFAGEGNIGHILEQVYWASNHQF